MLQQVESDLYIFIKVSIDEALRTIQKDCYGQ